jgi:hypothetical protein
MYDAASAKKRIYSADFNNIHYVKMVIKAAGKCLIHFLKGTGTCNFMQITSHIYQLSEIHPLCYQRVSQTLSL